MAETTTREPPSSPEQSVDTHAPSKARAPPSWTPLVSTLTRKLRMTTMPTDQRLLPPKEPPVSAVLQQAVSAGGGVVVVVAVAVSYRS